MKVTKHYAAGTKAKQHRIDVVDFGSLEEFYQYCINTPFNKAFEDAHHSSVHGSEYFTGTKSFEQAVELMHSGWTDMAGKLVQKLKAAEAKQQPQMKPRPVRGPAGYQAIVPAYLNGDPNNMVGSKRMPVKQKVVTLNKCIDYSGGTSTETIIGQSVKSMQLIKRIESLGYRVNLNVIVGASDGPDGYMFVAKVRVKSAGERLNVSKLAFPLVHPSMLRRIGFRFTEVWPETPKSMVWGYGGVPRNCRLRGILGEGEYLLPPFINIDVNEIKALEDLNKIA